MITLHKATIEDVLDIRNLLIDVWRDTYKSFLTSKTIDALVERWLQPETLKSQIENDSVFFLVAKIKGKRIIGLTNARIGEKNKILLHRLYVHPLYQQKGLGKKLLEEAINAFQKAESIKLEVRDQNEQAIAFYQKLGFEKIGTKEEKMNDLVLKTIEMEKALILPHKEVHNRLNHKY